MATDKKLPLKEEDATYLKTRAQFINQKIIEINKTNKELREGLLHEQNDKGDRRKFLFEIPFNAVTFHDLDDKKGYKKGTFVNFDVLGIHTIRIFYLEGKSGGGYGAFAGLRLQFIWNNLHTAKVTKDGIANPYYSGSFDDVNLCFGRHYYFQTKEQYIEFTKIYNDVKKLAESLSVDFI